MHVCEYSDGKRSCMISTVYQTPRYQNATNKHSSFNKGFWVSPQTTPLVYRVTAVKAIERSEVTGAFSPISSQRNTLTQQLGWGVTDFRLFVFQFYITVIYWPSYCHMS